MVATGETCQRSLPLVQERVQQYVARVQSARQWTCGPYFWISPIEVFPIEQSLVNSTPEQFRLLAAVRGECPKLSD